MFITNGDVLTMNNKDKYIVVESARYEDVDYLFTNKLTNEEEPTEEYYIMKKNNENIDIVTDKKILDIILPVFTNKLQKDLEETVNLSKFEIDDNN